MLSLHDLSVAQVSGMIAAAVFLIQLSFGLALPLVLLGLLNRQRSGITISAVSWSVFSRTLHSSHWPSILLTDSASATGVKKVISLASWFDLLMIMLIGIASVVTPLGLYQDIVPVDTTTAEFQYVPDAGIFGYGTSMYMRPPWLRYCYGGCPGAYPTVSHDDQVHNGHHNPPTTVNLTVPAETISLLESGLSTLQDSVSSIFDLRWRAYEWSGWNGVGAGFHQHVVGTYQRISSLLPERQIHLVEGLIVDMIDGGIGFRNHSIPPPYPFGSTWTEDILFIEPETQCVHTNLSLDLKFVQDRFGSATVESVTDRGGFVYLDPTIPTQNGPWNQSNPGLYERAYEGAFWNNVNTMFAWNLADPRDGSKQAFQNQRSELGKSHHIITLGDISSTDFRTIELTSGYGSYLKGYMNHSKYKADFAPASEFHTPITHVPNY
jgi:hypothetical protein